MDLWHFFISSLRKAAPTAVLQTIDFAREMDISRGMSRSPLQDSFRFRARFLAFEVAEVLIDEHALLRQDVLKALVEELSEKRFLIAPFLENDAFLFEHIFSSLRFLSENDQARKLLNMFSTPLCHRGADRLIRDTLWPRTLKEMTPSDVKKAVLAAWFTWLRQTTGSCFATAPAILIQQEQPLLLLQDLFDLLTFGSLKRIVSGREYLVPLCPSLEMADLLRPLTPYSAEDLMVAPGLRAAFAAAGMKVEFVEGANTPKELIELTFMRALGLDLKQIKEEEALKRFELNPLLAKQSAVYYQKPSPRAKKVAEWKEKTAIAFTAYQSLGDCALLRAWESTVASFSDVKVDIGRWNLYVSLGMNGELPGGIGAFLYERVGERLRKMNEELLALQGDYNYALSLARNAQQQQQTQEYMTAMYTVNALAEKSKLLSSIAEDLSKLFSIMIHAFDRLIPESFQEIFDPSLATNLSEMIDDSPAGFRLAHKHGRIASSQWTFIRSSDEFITAVREFFEYAERDLVAEFNEQRDLIEALSTELIQYIQTDEFLAGAIDRAKKNPAMQGGHSKPWEYISGGTMPALVMTYFNRSEPFTLLERKIQNEEELLIFITDIGRPSTSVLMHSPTHAFVFRPDFLPPDIPAALQAMVEFWKSVEIQDEAWLAEKFSSWLPQKDQPLFLHQWRLQNVGGNVQKFRTSLLRSMPRSRSDAESLVDSFLYESLPLINPQKATALGAEIAPCESFFQDAPFYTPTFFRERVKAAALAQAKSPLFAEDLDERIAAMLRSHGLAAPRPILFADTNWSVGFFGLAISPTGLLSLWRCQRTGLSGTPMHQWFDLQRNGTWIALTRPEEYRVQ